MRSSTLQEVAVVWVKKFSTMCFCCVNVPRVHRPNYQNKTASKGVVLNSNIWRSRFSKGSNVTDIYGKGQKAPWGFFSCCTKINTKKLSKKKTLTTAKIRRLNYDNTDCKKQPKQADEMKFRHLNSRCWKHFLFQSQSPDQKLPSQMAGPSKKSKAGKNSEAIYSFSGWFAAYWIMKVAAVDFCLLQSISRLRCHHTRRWSQTGTWQMARHLRQHDVPHAYV